MANGQAQFWTQTFVDPNGAPYAGAKIYHYAVSSTTAKTVWLDAGRTTPAPNPVIADSSGRAWFYGDGDYRVRVESNASELLYDWDFVRITADTGTMWEGDNGLTIPSATSLNEGQLFAQTDVGGSLVDLHFNEGVGNGGFAKVPASFKTSTKAGLPTAGSAGRVRLLTDDLRNVWIDNGSEWVQSAGGVANIKEFGAAGDGVTNDTSAIQDAIDAVVTAGGGTVLFPPGVYAITQVTVGSKVRLIGTGPDACTLISRATSNIRGMITNTDQTSGNNRIVIDGMSIIRDTTAGIVGGLNEAVYMKNVEFLWIHDCIISGTASGASSLNGGVNLEEGLHYWIRGNRFNGFASFDIRVYDPTADAASYAVIVGNIFDYNAGNWDHHCVDLQQDMAVVSSNMLNSISGSDPQPKLVAIQTKNKGYSITGNVVDNGDICRVKAGTEITITGNTCKNGQILIENITNDVADVLIANNAIDGGQIQLDKTSISNQFERMDVIGNVVYRPPSASGAGIYCNVVRHLSLRNNSVRDGANHGIHIISDLFFCQANLAEENAASGFVFDRSISDPATNPHALVMNNYSRANDIGYNFQRTNDMEFVDNQTADNVSNTETFNLTLLFGVTRPILFWRGVTLGQPDGVIPAGPGSMVHVLGCGDYGSLPRGLYVKRINNTSSGWYAIDQGGGES